MTTIESVKREQIRLQGGQQVTLSTAKLPDGTYETMLLDAAGEEVAGTQSSTEKDALYWHKHIREEYEVPEPKGRYKKLVEDIAAAIAYGREHMGDDDGGTSNLDAPTISLPGWSQKKVEAAMKEAGTRCFIWNLWGSKSYVFSIGGTGQGYTRTKAAEAARDYLKERGYNAGVYYQMD